MNKKLFYNITYTGAKNKYSIDILKNRLLKLGIALEKIVLIDETAVQKPFLDIRCGNVERSEKFLLKWYPEGDIKDHFHSYFRLVSEFNQPLYDIYEGDNRYLNMGVIEAEGPAGVLQGILEFCELCEVYGGLPKKYIDITREPRLKFRSACLLLMKAGLYGIDITPKEFSWFYDKTWWIEYLDFMVQSRV